MTAKTHPGGQLEVQLITRHLSRLDLRKGARLPAERELANSLGLTRSKLRKGLDRLEAEGLIWRHVGKGTFIGPQAESRTGQAGLDVETSINPHDLMEARLIFEPRAASLAALRGTLAEFDAISGHFERSLAAKSVAEYEVWDARFHRAIICAARNTLLAKISELIDSIRDERLWGTLKQRTSTPQRRSHYSLQHRRILAALTERRSADAEEAMREHLRDVQNDLLGSSETREARGF